MASPDSYYPLNVVKQFEDAGVQANAISDVPVDGSAAVADNADAINALLAALRDAGVVATS